MPCFFFDLGGGWVEVAGSQALAANTWYHLCVVYDGTQALIYLDGVPRGSLTQAGQLRGVSNDLWFARSSGGGEYATCRLRDVRIYNRGLPATVVQQMVDPRTRFDLCRLPQPESPK